jgi:aspartate-semialdehyde dehydrogenase
VTDEIPHTIDIAVVGATGLVGSAVIDLLAERNITTGKIYPLASADSDGKTVDYGQHKLTVHRLDAFDFGKVQIAVFAVPANIAREYIPRAVSAGCIVIDHSPVYRDDSSVPLVQAELNADEIADYQSAGIVACPDSSTAHVALALAPLLALPVSRITVHAMRAVSDIGRAGINELSEQSIALFNLKEIKSRQFPVQTAFNILPVARSDASMEMSLEQAIEKELQEIFQRSDTIIRVSTVQVPVFFGHSYKLLIEFKEEIDSGRILQLLHKNSWIELVDSADKSHYPTVVTDAVHNTHVVIDQNMIKGDKLNKLALWMVADNLHCGVASNSVQIAEILVKDHL